ncbi:MAG TPA: malto-oligosyltrehalose synthase [Ramlibacter sp.]|uniref:malto-oligosyltrehalose synthase n=1 Tax=Ramlibacter sp. TaxID=1917967 RepID=UPI002C83D171|nr:malto-oligosyltrehalose synthase [Ramlibacter sp.]HVZ43744.1 malto-oligosyltrehalose synthase [Ramlibacter sp.]
MMSLAERAARHGVADRYHSFWGEEQAVTDAVLRAALSAMGLDPESEAWEHEGFPPVHVVGRDEPCEVRWAGHEEAGQAWQVSAEGETQVLSHGHVEPDGGHCVIRITEALAPGYYTLQAGAGVCRLVIAPPRCWCAEPLESAQRWWGCTVQLYALRSSRNWGIGDFGDLRRLVDTAARQGASFIGLSPLHALFPHNPGSASPYSPSSRTAFNPIYLDVQTLAEFASSPRVGERLQSESFQERLRALRECELVDYAGAAAAKEEILRLLWRDFALRADDPRVAQFDAYVRERENTTGRHALFEALQAHLWSADPSVWGWPAWPEEYRDPDGQAVREFAREHADEVRFRFWLQWLTERQLESVQRYARSRGMGIGLYCDLAVGVNGGGSDTWVHTDVFALGMHAGAPPDALNVLGQDWGLPPWNPRRLKAARYQPFIDMLRANMRHCGALRLDHAMALMRLFWTGPQGGTYVSYPLADLMGILALESHRHRCMVIGEDLGTVAPRMREAMRERRMLSYRPLLFERSDDGGFKPPAQWQPQALAVVSTHDLPTLRGFWLGEDIELAAALSLYPDDATRERQVLQRAQDRAHLLIALERESLLPEGMTVQPTSMPDATPAFVEAVYAYLARTPSWLVGVQLEDLTGQVLHVNVPGTTEDRFPNWRRKLAVSVGELASEPRWARVAAVLKRERSGPVPAELAHDALPPLATANVPRATYRVQFHRGFTFDDAARAIPYLHALGVSHLYSSPYLKARPGSTHGYDIVDHAEVNPEVGDAVRHERFCQALRRHGMGQILDIVPNHMGVLEADNAWWLDVLEHGRASRHANTFDIEWSPAAPEMQGRVLLPVLGDHYGRVLEAGEIRLGFDAQQGEFGLRYWAHRFPVDPQRYPDIFAALPAPPARDETETDSHAVVSALLDAFGRLPTRDAPEEAERRARDSGVYKRTLARLVARHEWLAHWIEACLNRLNGRPGEAASFDELDRLISAQAYRLADWRVASDDVNYRRFFDVNTLAALRMERPEVFEATHRRILQWLQDGWLSGLRIDHPDGLSDPEAYFLELQSHYARQAMVAGAEPRALYLVVEKILAEHEQLPEAWRVHGHTGYRFASLVGALFVDARNEHEMSAAYRGFTGEWRDFDEVVYGCKKLIIETSLFSELEWLTQALHRITRANRRRRDFTRNRLRIALAEVAANFPVYRTYLRPGAAASAMDRQHTDWAVAAAKRRLGGAEATVLDHVREVLLGEGEAADAAAELRDRFVARWQQFTAPVMAKSMEDTAFYRWLRLVSLNEVGSDPRSFGMSVAAFHAANLGRQRYRPHGLLATSTHDSKRSEDLRARIGVLSEDPFTWREMLQRLAGWAEMYLTRGDKEPMPSRNDVWLLFQTLVGLWPITPPGDEERESIRERMQAYMLKAVREAKQHTNWHCPVTSYEEALAKYVDAILRAGPNPFADELQRFAARIAPFGFMTSLAQLALKFTVPGVPDIYQGCEQWSFSLVDPDNRRGADFERLARDLQSLEAMQAGAHPSPEQWHELHESIADGRIKQLVTWRLLRLRRDHERLFRDGHYAIVTLEGPAADHAVAFARVHEDEPVVLVVAARLLYTLCGGEARHWAPVLWRGTRARWNADTASLRRARAWRNWMTGARVMAADAEEGGLELEALFADAGALPFVVLLAEDGRS